MLGYTTRCLLSPETANNLLLITQPVVVRQVEQEKESRMAVATRQGREKPAKWNKRRSEDLE